MIGETTPKESRPKKRQSPHLSEMKRQLLFSPLPAKEKGTKLPPFIILDKLVVAPMALVSCVRSGTTIHICFVMIVYNRKWYV